MHDSEKETEDLENSIYLVTCMHTVGCNTKSIYSLANIIVQYICVATSSACATLEGLKER